MPALRNLTDQRFGRLLALERVPRPGAKHAFWRCRCDCNRELAVSSDALLSGGTSSCGCSRAQDRPFFQREGGAVRAPLTKGKSTYLDQCDEDLVAATFWQAHSALGGRLWYAARTVGGRHEQLHRLVGVRMGFPPGLDVDHRDGDGLNNRRSNLRPATDAENQQNRGASSKPSGAPKGVHFHRQSGRWEAKIMVEKKAIYLGLFDTVTEAAAAYASAAREHFGEFARPQEG